MIDGREAAGDARCVHFRRQDLRDVGLAAVERPARFVGIERSSDFVPHPIEEVTLRWLYAQQQAEKGKHNGEFHRCNALE